MKSIRIVAVTVLLLALAPLSRGGALTGASTRDSLWENPVKRWSIGGDYLRLKRDVEFDNGPSGELDSEQFYAFVSYDLTSWASLFGTFGQSDATFEDGEEGDFDTRWSIGAAANLWSMDVFEPSALEGILSLHAGVEYGRAASGFEGGDADWSQIDIVLPVHFEVEVLGVKERKKIPSSLDLYVGPALSWIDGSADAADGSRDFNEKDSLGVVAGIQLYFSYNLCAGIQFDIFDGTTYRAGLRYHF